MSLSNLVTPHTSSPAVQAGINMDKAAARRARFNAPSHSVGLVSRGDKILTKEEQIELFNRVKTSPTSHSVRSLREAVLSSGPSRFAAEVFEFAIKYAIESGELATLQSSLARLLHTIHPLYPLSDPDYYMSLYVISLSSHDLERAAQELLNVRGVDYLGGYLKAVGNSDISMWVAIVKQEVDVLRRKLMLTQKPIFLTQAELLSKSYKQNGTWIREYVESCLVEA